MKNVKNRFNFKRHNPEYLNPAFLYPIATMFKIMRGWQSKAFDKVKDAPYVAIQAFCGSGKSLLQIILAIYDIIKSDYKQKQLFIVPQEHIGGGFVGDDELNYIKVSLLGQEYEWCILPEDNFTKGLNRVKKLKKWLLTPPSKLPKGNNKNIMQGLSAVCCYPSLISAFKSLGKRERRIAIKNLTLRVDEAHHISNVFLDDELEEGQKIAVDKAATELGKICMYILNNPSTKSKICTTTATMYRGDRQTILSQSVRDKFTEYNMDWLEHFNSLGIRDFALYYEEYDKDPINLIVKNIKKQKRQKHLIIVPSTTHKWRTFGKKELEKLKKELYKVYPKERVLDLVTKETQQKNKKLLLSEPKRKSKNKPSKFDVVIMCMLGREGTDWCPCSRIHNTACESSITLSVQTLGRVFRIYEGKKDIKIYHYVRKFEMPREGLTKRELLSDRTNAVLFCMQLNDMFNPIIIPTLSIEKKNNNKKKEEKVVLSDIFGDQYQNVCEELVVEYESLEVKTEDTVLKLIDSILDEHEIIDNRKNVRDGLFVKLFRTATPDLELQGIDIEFLRKAGFDKLIKKMDPSIHFKGIFSVKDWKKIREISSQEKKRTPQEWFEIAKEVAMANVNGELDW